MPVILQVNYTTVPWKWQPDLEKFPNGREEKYGFAQSAVLTEGKQKYPVIVRTYPKNIDKTRDLSVHILFETPKMTVQFRKRLLIILRSYNHKKQLFNLVFDAIGKKISNNRREVGKRSFFFILP
jgi:hypothetical protein